MRAASRQLQDDHYDGLLDRPDYLRQSQRLRGALAQRGTARSVHATSDGDRRVILRRALERVVVLPHPRGRASAHLDWSQRCALLTDRLQLTWA